MKKITANFVKKVKKHNRAAWHDQAWWDFAGRADVEAVNYVLTFSDSEDRADNFLVAERASTGWTSN